MGFKWAFCGPLESQDLAGLQTTAAMVHNIEQDLSNTRELPSFLKEMVENDELTTETIPSLKTIENWIARFSSLSKKEHAEQILAE